MMIIIIIVEGKKANDEVIRSPPLKVKKKVIWVHKGAVQAPHRYMLLLLIYLVD
jgi:hypothetical protein